MTRTGKGEFPLEFIHALTQAEGSCYEQVKQIVMSLSPQPHTYGYKYLYRVKEHCLDRIVRRGYGRNPINKERGQGTQTDFDRAFQGYDSILADKVKQ